MYAVIGVITILSLLGHGMLLALVFGRRHTLRTPLVVSALPLIIAALMLIPMVRPLDWLMGGPEALSLILGILSTGYIAAFGVAVLRDVTGRKGRLWLIVALVWQIALAAVLLASDLSEMDEPGWLDNLSPPSTASLVAVVGFTAVSLFLLGILARAYVQARVPEAANRALFWFVVSAVALMSVFFLMSGSRILLLIGILLLVAANTGSTYLQVSRRILDLRAQLGDIGRSGLLLALGSTIIVGTLALAYEVDLESEDATIFVGVLAVAASVAYATVEFSIRTVARRMSAMREGELAVVAERYSRDLTSAADFGALAEAAAGMLRQELPANAAVLLRVEAIPNTSNYEILMGSGDDSVRIGTLTSGNPLHQRLAVERRPLTQYDIDHNPRFRALSADKRAEFGSLNMNMFAPVLIDERLVAILAAGPKADDTPYGTDEIRLMTTLANQTAVALRAIALGEARQKAETKRSTLELQLVATQKQIDALDSVKTDFLAVASHELRTPLAQLRGNVDLLEALSHAEALDVNESRDITASLRSATERLESLVRAMLDVSQIEVDALFLDFAPVALEEVVRAAAEPFTAAIRQRRIGVSIHDLRELPTIEADGERLTQAIRNVLLNAVKYTPDNGRIDVSAAHEPAKRAGERETVLLVVRDSGVGIDAENIELIFRKFFRAHDPGTHSSGEAKFMGAGPGLGLSIVKGIVEGHGGSVWAESAGYDPDGCPGTTVYIRLPVRQDESALPQPSAVTDPAASPLES